MIKEKTFIILSFVMLAVLFILQGIALVSGESLESLNQVTPGETINIRQTCVDATYITISITYPNGTLALTGQALADNTNGLFTYDFTDTTTPGRYDVCGVSDGCEKTFCTYFTSGEELTGSTSALYIVMIILSFGIMLLFIFFGILIEGNNYSDENGIIQVNNKKYLKMGCFFMAYIVGIWFMFNLWTIADSFLFNTFMTNMFRSIWFFMVSSLVPIFIAFVILNIYWLVVDKRFKELIVMGVPTNMD
jgi:hypothetical protein